jgi:acetate kinase
LCDSANLSVTGETKISSQQSKVDVWVVPTNEEIVVARQTKALVEGN